MKDEDGWIDIGEEDKSPISKLQAYRSYQAILTYIDEADDVQVIEATLITCVKGNCVRGRYQPSNIPDNVTLRSFKMN